MPHIQTNCNRYIRNAIYWLKFQLMGNGAKPRGALLLRKGESFMRALPFACVRVGEAGGVS
jgi:hypothetical protein